MVKKWFQKLSVKLKSRFENKFREQKKPFIVPSKFGVYFGSGILVIILLAFTYANQLLYLIAFFYSSFLFIIMHLTNNNMKYLKIESFFIPSFFQDQKGKLSLTIKNEHSKYNSRFVYLSIQEFQIKKEITLIKPLETITLFVDFEAKQRGLFPYPRLNLETTFPFGIFYSWKRINRKLNYFVYPFRDGNKDLPYSDFNDSKDPTIINKVVEPSLEGDFSMHKKYTQRDSFKRIDWKVFARTNKLYVKVYDKETRQILFINFEEHLRDLDPSSFEKKINQLTKWIFISLKNNIPCFIKIQHKTIELLQTPKDYENIFQILALERHDSKNHNSNVLSSNRKEVAHVSL